MNGLLENMLDKRHWKVIMSKASTIAGIAQAADTTARGWANFGLQTSNYRYQKELQNTLFAREDTAIRRAAADMEAAGLSKTLAVGSAAQAGEAIRTQAPQAADDSGIGAIMMGIQFDQMIRESNARIDKTRAESDLIKLQQVKTGVETGNLEVMRQQMKFGMIHDKISAQRDRENIVGMQIENRNRQERINAEIRHLRVSADRLASLRDLDNAEVRMIDSEISKNSSTIKKLEVEMKNASIRGDTMLIENARERKELLEEWNDLIRTIWMGGTPKTHIGKLIDDLSRIITRGGENEQWAEMLLRHFSSFSADLLNPGEREGRRR